MKLGWVLGARAAAVVGAAMVAGALDGLIVVIPPLRAHRGCLLFGAGLSCAGGLVAPWRAFRRGMGGPSDVRPGVARPRGAPPGKTVVLGAHRALDLESGVKLRGATRPPWASVAVGLVLNLVISCVGLVECDRLAPAERRAAPIRMNMGERALSGLGGRAAVFVFFVVFGLVLFAVALSVASSVREQRQRMSRGAVASGDAEPERRGGSKCLLRPERAARVRRRAQAYVHGAPLGVVTRARSPTATAGVDRPARLDRPPRWNPGGARRRQRGARHEGEQRSGPLQHRPPAAGQQHLAAQDGAPGRRLAHQRLRARRLERHGPARCLHEARQPGAAEEDPGERLRLELHVLVRERTARLS